MSHFGLSGRVTLEGRVLFAGTLRCEPGWTCLLGPSGSGKSTLLRLLAGLPAPALFEGEVTRPGRIGWMAQSDLLQPRLTLAQNVDLIGRLAGEPARPGVASELLASVGLAGMGQRRPGSLSGGQRQRVALARVLMQEAPLVLLDEPFSALDPALRREMQDLAHRTLQGRAVLMVTHDPAEALRLADRIFVLEHGGLRAVAPAAGPGPRDHAAGAVDGHDAGPAEPLAAALTGVPPA